MKGFKVIFRSGAAAVKCDYHFSFDCISDHFVIVLN